MDLVQLIESTKFLGEEYLTWLWYRLEKQDGLFDIGTGKVEVYFEDQLTLEARLSEAELNRLSGGSPSESTEAREALRRGKRVAKVKVRVVKEGREWQVTMAAQTLGLSGIKIPAVLGEAEDDRFYERMYLIEELEGILRGLYGQFLAVRLDEKAWDAEVTRVRTWVGSPALSVVAGR